MDLQTRRGPQEGFPVGDSLALYIQIKDWLPLEEFLAFVNASEWSLYAFPGLESPQTGPSSAGTESGQ